MNPFLIFIFGAVAGGAAALLIARRGLKGEKHELREETNLIGRQAGEKKRNKEAILGILDTQSPLTNNHVEQLLGISDATATRYLEELEKEGRVRQVGTTGRYVYYEKAK